ncbi:MULTISPECIES: ring-cleaving dioxygenase [unclassified Listeria]|uniref:ring-cleaving dioxygenase n=1 Tax=unclassified Listeria TaxID=2642072 RepID=UPI000B58BF8D|nr:MULTISPECIES: ring-cleaving dioxygenase [unclassified Listeria]
MELLGLHHISIFTENARRNFDFYTKVLGMRLVKKTVNQDDPYTYHLYYADEIGNPGTTVTFFEVPNMAKNRLGRNQISAMSLRVPNDAALEYWHKRLDEFQIFHSTGETQFGRRIIRLKDVDGLTIHLVSDEGNSGTPAGHPWKDGPVPIEYAISGLGPVRISVLKKEKTDAVLTKLLGFKHAGAYEENEKLLTVYQTGAGGTGAEVHLEARTDLEQHNLGAGGVHHLAFRVKDDAEMLAWVERIADSGYPNSGFIDRFYFHSLYFRESNGILFELATDGPGFNTNFEVEHGTYVELPPKFESRREEIEAHLTPLDTDK